MLERLTKEDCLLLIYVNYLWACDRVSCGIITRLQQLASAITEGSHRLFQARVQSLAIKIDAQASDAK